MTQLSAALKSPRPTALPALIPVFDSAESQRILDTAIRTHAPATISDLDETWRVTACFLSANSRFVEIDQPVAQSRTGVLRLRFSVAGITYSFSTSEAEGTRASRSSQRSHLDAPQVLYREEKRDRVRRPATLGAGSARLITDDGDTFTGELRDYSDGGACVELARSVGLQEGQAIEVSHSELSDTPALGRIASVAPSPRGSGWTRVGLTVFPARQHEWLSPVAIDELSRDIGSLESLPINDFDPVGPHRVKFYDSSGNRIVGTIDCVGNPIGAPAVIIPPAWGKTKETLVGLALTLLATFSRRGLPLLVLRFDGVRKRGESENDPEATKPSEQNLHYTFSQGSLDVEAASSYLAKEFGAERQQIVSFSIASVEARRTIARDTAGRFRGWVSVVGATDPQSLMRVISGGADYFGGAEQGLRFGRREVQGLLLDIDNAADDALDQRIAFLEDARRDFAAIECPITWIAGTNDAWMSVDRARDVMSFGTQDGRRVITADTGHQLRDSQQAMSVFGVVASECVRHLHGLQRVRPAAPTNEYIRQRTKLELRKRNDPAAKPQLQSFWRRYLLGRPGRFGMELVTETNAHRALLNDQIEALELHTHHKVLDLGCGIASLASALSRRGDAPNGIAITSVDYVIEALRRGQSLATKHHTGHRSFAAADLDLSGQTSLPFRSSAFDRVLLSLVLNYLETPDVLLRELARVLTTDGMVVMSVLRTDADTSRICVEGVAELRSGGATASFGAEKLASVESSLPDFINDASRILELEEQGAFKFWEAEELSQALNLAGFRDITVCPAFGNPPQAWLARATVA